MRNLRAFGTVALLATAGSAHAAIIDLTQPNTFGVVNGARFETADFQSAGTGTISSFVRIQARGKEEGYNTSGRPVPFDEKTDQNFTTDIRLSQLPTVDLGGISYYAFQLDINESLGGDNSLLSLDQVKIFTSPDGSKTTTDVGSLGVLQYDLDAGGDNWIKLDAGLSSGSGQGDMNLLVPVSAFDDAGANDFVYLYSQFGTNIGADAGFEEWSFLPSPGPIVLGALASIVIVGRRRALNA